MVRRIERHSGRLVGGAIFALLATIAVFARGDQRVGTAGLSSPERELLQEYRANYNRLEQFYNNVRMDVTYRRTDYSSEDGKGKPQRMARYLVYRANSGELLRMDVSPLKVEDESPTGETSVELARPKEGVFVASRKTTDSTFVLDKVHAQYDKGFLVGYKFYAAPYTAYLLPMEFMVFERADFLKTLEVESVACQDEGKDRLVTITVTGVTERRNRKWRGRFVLYRDKSWALREATCGVADIPTAQDTTLQCRYEYEGMYEGVPLLKRAKYWQEQGPTRQRYQEEVFDVRKIEPGAVPEEEFTLDALGIKVAGQGKVPRFYFVLAAGIAALLVAILLARRFRRDRA
jgi:hypothetical protein